MAPGLNSIAIRINDDMMFRVAKKESAGRRYRVEWALLPVLNPRLPFEIPMPQWIIHSADGLP